MLKIANMAQCDFNRSRPIINSKFYQSANSWLKSVSPSWFDFNKAVEGIAFGNREALTEMKNILKSWVLPENERTLLKELATKAFYYGDPSNKFVYAGGMPKHIAKKFFDTIRTLAKITSEWFDTVAFSYKKGNRDINVTPLYLWRSTILNAINQIEDGVSLNKLLDIAWAEGWSYNTAFNYLYNFMPDSLRKMIFKGKVWDKQIDFGLLMVAKNDAKIDNINMLFERLSDYNQVKRPSVTQQMRSGKKNIYNPLNWLSALAENKWYQNLNRIFRILPQFGAILALIPGYSGKLWGFTSLVNAGFISSWIRNVSAKQLSGINKSELNALPVWELLNLLWIEHSDLYNEMLDKIWGNPNVPFSSLSDITKFMLFSDWRAIWDMIGTGPQNIAVDWRHAPSYLQYAFFLSTKNLGVFTLDQYYDLMKTPTGKAVLQGEIKKSLELFFATHSEASSIRNQYPMLYHTFMSFGQWWWNVAKQLAYGPITFVRNTILGLNRGQVLNDGYNIYADNAEVKLAIATLVKWLLRASKAMRLYGPDEDEEDKPFFKRELDFYVDFFQNFNSYGAAFFSNGVLRQILLPTIFNYERSLDTVDWERVPLDASDVLLRYLQQGLSEIRTSNKFATTISKVVKKFKEGSFTPDDEDDALKEFIDMFFEWYGTAVSNDMYKGLNEGGYIPQGTKRAADILFSFGEAGSQLSDLNFGLSNDRSFLVLIDRIRKWEDLGENIGKLVEKTGYGFLAWTVKDMVNMWSQKELIEETNHTNQEVKVMVDTLREAQLPWTDANVDFNTMSAEVKDYLLFSTLKTVFGVSKEGQIFGSYNSPYYEDEYGNQWLNSILKRGRRIDGVNPDGSVKYKAVYDYDLYRTVFDNQMKTIYPDQYEGIKKSILESMKGDANYNERNESIHKYMELYQDIAPKTKLALAMKAYIDIRIEQAWGNTYLGFDDSDTTNAGRTTVNPLSVETRERIKADVLNTFQRPLRDVDGQLFFKAFILSQADKPEVNKFVNETRTELDYRKLGNDGFSSTSLAMTQFFVGMGLSRGENPTKWNNTLNSLVFNYAENLERRWVDKDSAQVAGLTKFMDLLPDTYYSEQDKQDLVMSTFLNSNAAIQSLYSNPKLIETLGADTVNRAKAQVYQSYKDLNMDLVNRDFMNQDVNNLRDASGKLFGYDNLGWGGFGKTGYYSSYNKTYPNIKPINAAFRTVVPLYLTESRVNFGYPKEVSYNRTDYDLFRSQQNYVKNSYIQTPRLNKQWNNTLVGNVGRGKGFALTVKRSKSWNVIKAKSWNKGTSKKAKSTNSGRA